MWRLEGGRFQKLALGLLDYSSSYSTNQGSLLYFGWLMSMRFSITQSRTEEIIRGVSMNYVASSWTNAKHGHSRNLSLRTRLWELTLWVPDINVNFRLVPNSSLHIQAIFFPSVDGHLRKWPGTFLCNHGTVTSRFIFSNIWKDFPSRTLWLQSRSWVLYLDFSLQWLVWPLDHQYPWFLWLCTESNTYWPPICLF